MINAGRSRNSVLLTRRLLSTGGFWQGSTNGTMSRTINNVNPFKLRFIPKTAPTATEIVSSDVVSPDGQRSDKKPFKFIVSSQIPAKKAGKSPKWSSYAFPSPETIQSHEEAVKKQNQAIDEQKIAAEVKSDCSCTEPPKKRKRKLRPRKALITLSPKAIKHLRGLLAQPEPKLIRVSARNRGCSGLTYDLQYISEPGKFDEVVEQDGVKIVIDSKALFSIIGSEMDWVDDKLASKFVFKNPNSKGTCGCGESFMV